MIGRRDATGGKKRERNTHQFKIPNKTCEEKKDRRADSVILNEKNSFSS